MKFLVSKMQKIFSCEEEKNFSSFSAVTLGQNLFHPRPFRNFYRVLQIFGPLTDCFEILIVQIFLENNWPRKLFFEEKARPFQK